MTTDLDAAALSELLKLVDRAHSRCALNVTDMTILSALPALVAEVQESRVKLRVYHECIVGQAEMMDALRAQLSAATHRAEEAEKRAEKAAHLLEECVEVVRDSDSISDDCQCGACRPIHDLLRRSEAAIRAALSPKPEAE